MEPTVGFIGLGVIGLPMAERLQQQGLPLVVWNRTAQKADGLLERGAQRASTPEELARSADIVITMVTDGPAVEALAFGSGGLVAALTPGKVHCDMSTIGPDTSHRLAVRYASCGVPFLQAPVLGNRHAAAAGTLLIFAGGPREAFEKCKPVFEALGRKIWHLEEASTASAMKLASNLLLAGMMQVFGESLVLAAKAGIRPRTMLEVIGQSALAAPMFETKGEAIARGDFTPNFYLRNMLKDLELVLDASNQWGVELPATRAVRGAFAAAAEQGLAELDYSAVVKWLEQRAALAAAR
ncbi:MAG TPA: NAD(P)-dependent oxidoreductase [Candidatus Acidoferrales bacterium]|nr:NAD(P)-dependent oxidoreductase [Candidatus Acidoferrales bacterium]